MNTESQMTTKRKQLSSSEFKCEFCNKTYKKLSTLENHLSNCTTHIRYQLRDTDEIKIAHSLWIQFSYTRDRSIEKFEKSKDYNYFTKFTIGAIEKKWNHIHQYGMWLLNNKVSYSHWLKEEYYTKFIKYYNVTEHPRDAVIRSIEVIHNMGYYGKFMSDFPIGRGLLLIEKGSISPWIFFIFGNSKDFLDRIREDQIEYFDKVVNVDIWLNRTKRYEKQLDRLQDELKGVNI